MSSGNGAGEVFLVRGKAERKRIEKSRSLKEAKQPLCSPVVSTAALCCCVFQAARASV